MKIKNGIWIIILLMIPGLLPAQEKTAKELKEQKKLEEKKKTEELVNSKTFVFTGTHAYPQGGRSVDLTTRANYVKFSPEMIKGDMPFFGRAYSGVGYGGSGGLEFEGKPEEFTVNATKNGWQVKAVVKYENDSYTLSLMVSPGGSTSMTITTVNRSPINYSGEITKPEQPEN